MLLQIVIQGSVIGDFSLHTRILNHLITNLLIQIYTLNIYIQSKLDNSTLTGRSFHVELASMLSYRMYKLMTEYIN